MRRRRCIAKTLSAISKCVMTGMSLASGLSRCYACFAVVLHGATCNLANAQAVVSWGNEQEADTAATSIASAWLNNKP